MAVSALVVLGVARERRSSMLAVPALVVLGDLASVVLSVPASVAFDVLPSVVLDVLPSVVLDVLPSVSERAGCRWL